MRIINLTPHVLRLYADDMETVVVEIPPTVPAVRVISVPGALEDWGLPVPVAGVTQWGDIEGLPWPEEGVVFVVSLLVAQQARRRDVRSPGSGPNDRCVRDSEGRIAGVTRLIAHV